MVRVVLGVVIGADTYLYKFAQNYVRLFPYGVSGIIISVLLIVVGARVVSESRRWNFKGPSGAAEALLHDGPPSPTTRGP